MAHSRRALISVSNKTGLVDFARVIESSGFQILSTGGTARLLRDNNVSVMEVSEHTGFPEIMGGRVKTLHPKIHGGLLGRRGQDDDVMVAHDIAPIDIVVVNLYPFAETIAQPGCQLSDAIENIDIGGPAMIRAAAKNFEAVTVIVDPTDYSELSARLATDEVTRDERLALARKAYAHTSAYDAMVSSYLHSHVSKDFPEVMTIGLRKKQSLRYGENPHQAAVFYEQSPAKTGSLATANQLQGKPLSYNNIADADAALQCVRQFEQPACVIVKHTNPCGVAIDNSPLRAYERAFKTDPTSAFGGIIAFNNELDETTASAIIERQFVEVIVAPGLTAGAKNALNRKQNIRVLQVGNPNHAESKYWELRQVGGGVLIQEADLQCVSEDKLKVVSKRQPGQDQIKDLLFAWRVAKFVKSNAIVFAKDLMTVGVGAGQMSRVYSTKIAAIKAQDENLVVKGSMMASDAFFPFRDGIDAAAEHGIAAIIQPGGSMRDEEVIAAADEHDMAMVFTGERHFRH